MKKNTRLIAVKSNHSVESYCLRFEEKPRPGKFYPKKAKALGVPVGELWSKLQADKKSRWQMAKWLSQATSWVRRGRDEKSFTQATPRPFEAFAEFAAGC